jgi:voltage-gated potassium channel
MMVTLIVGLLLFVVDSNIKSPLDGIWSAWVTLTHVGFGDVVPISFFGRLLATGLILFGLILFSLFTALASVTLLGKNREVFGGRLPWVDQQAINNQSQENQILTELIRLHERMAVLENQLSSSQSVN